MQKSAMPRYAAALVLAVMFAVPPLSAADAPAEGVRHTVSLPSGPLEYRAIWRETVLKDEGGEQATISTITYLREGVSDQASRPVIFAFNGGPGASSSPLHTGLLGPVLHGKPDKFGKRTYTPNVDSILDIADVVLIDPVGTGFSRELQPGGNQKYWSIEGDAKAVEQAIREWLKLNGRERSPIYIAGESYGGYRLAAMSPQIVDLPVAGLVLVSPGLDLSGGGGHGNDQPFIFDLPAMAATAFFHGKAGAGKTADRVVQEATSFAQSEYAVALQKGNELPRAERDRVARRISALIGLPVETIVAHDLRVPSQEFLEQLVPGKVVGRIDTRVTGPKPAQAAIPGRIKAADDPALGLGKSNVIKSSAMRDYLKEATGYQGNADYISLSLDVNFSWDWRGRTKKHEDNMGRRPSAYLQAFAKQRKDARILLIGGYYDLATPWLGQRYSLTHAGIPGERISMQAFASGHAMYDDETRPSVAKLLRRFITQR
jgi:carboxypeptidase C (cathepsin A)